MLHRYFFPFVLTVALVSGCRFSSGDGGVISANSIVANAVTPRVGATIAAPLDKGNSLSYRVLPLKIASNNEPMESQISPDHRYIACFDSPKDKRERFVIYDLVTLQASRFDVGRAGDDSYVGEFFAWRQDSRACAVATSSGVAIVTLGKKNVVWASRKVLTFAACLSWSPVTHQLAIFEGDYTSHSCFHIWDGHEIVRRRDWQKAVGDDGTAYETAAMQAEWSPDEKLIAFRFEGSNGVSGTFTNPMELAILDAKTGRALWRYEGTAGPVHWIDKSRVVFQNTGYFYADALIVANPRTGKTSYWHPNVASWAISPKKDEVWALVRDGKEGNLYQSSTLKPQWTLVKRNLWQVNSDGSTEQEDDVRPPYMFVSPSGDSIALNYDASMVDLFDISEGKIWHWKNSIYEDDKGSVWFMGWVNGQKFPLVAYQPKFSEFIDMRWRLWQLEATK